MRHLGLALFSEGPTDDRFLGPLLQRLCQVLCLEHANDLVDVAEEMLPLRNPPGGSDAPRVERIARAAAEAAGAWQILFVHTDGAGDPETKHAQLVAPALARLRADRGKTGAGVAVVPVRETEAWALADGDALRAVFGTVLEDAALGVPPHARLVEAITDPKQALDSAYLLTRPSGRHARAGAAALLSAIGQQASLDRLRQVPSFARTEAGVLEALRQLRIAAAPRQ